MISRGSQFFDGLYKAIRKDFSWRLAMFKISPTSAVPVNSAVPVKPRTITVGTFPESFPQMSLRLAKAANCCDDNRRSWRDFQSLADNIAAVPKLRYYEVIPAIVKSVSSFRVAGKAVRIDKYIQKMKSDGSIGFLIGSGVSVNDVDSGEIIRNGEKAGKVAALLDKCDAPGAVRDFLRHFYLKITLPKLAHEKIRSTFMLHTLAHREYDADNNGAYPLLKFDGTAYRIKAIDRQSEEIEAGRSFPSAQVKPFIRSKLTGEQRKELYSQLEVRFLGSKDLAENERLLEGQLGVFAAQGISSGTCLGVHGGTVFSWEDFAADHGVSVQEAMQMINMDYLVNLQLEGRGTTNFILDGNNIISKVNSNFCPDGGEGWLQAKGGYNAALESFGCKMDDGRFIALPAIFTTRNVERGEEIRMNYHYSPEVATQAMNTGKIVAGANMDDLVKSILSPQDPDSGSLHAQAAAAREVSP
jgi:hypothetical protein